MRVVGAKFDLAYVSREGTVELLAVMHERLLLMLWMMVMLKLRVLLVRSHSGVCSEKLIPACGLGQIVL